MQHNNNIENKLREMEAMEQPNLGQMDDHWQQMAAILQPAVLPVKKIWPKWMLNGLSVVAVAVLIGAALLYLSSKKNSEGEKLANQNEITIKENSNNETGAVAATMNATDTSVTANTAIGLHKLIVNPSLVYYDIPEYGRKVTIPGDSNSALIKLNYIPCNGCNEREYGISGYSTERQLKLQSLFAQLEKQEQHFIVDNSRDTLLLFAEGTVLLLPANSFGGMMGIELTAKEFYKTSDIVLNQLSTASNKEQLETGGMLKLKASYKGKPLSVNENKPLTLFMADTSDKMKGMQLFNGKLKEQGQQAASNTITNETREGIRDTGGNGNSSYVNWLAQGVFFRKNYLQTQEKVLNLVNEPYQVKESSKGQVAYFTIGEENTLQRSEIKKLLKEKYGYHKVKLRADFRNHFFISVKRSRFITKDISGTKSEYSRSVGDSVWMDKATAKKYNLIGTATRQILSQDDGSNNRLFGGITIQMDEKGNVIRPVVDSAEIRRTDFILKSMKILDGIENKYGVDISQLGWINCDRFYVDSRKKINYNVDLGDMASNYYTMLVFDKINSMMTGRMNGNTVAFQSIPVGEPVKVISIGINKNGETVYSVTHTTTSEQGLKDVQFQATSAPELKTALSKFDD